jgi:transcriptional regulator with XRE-family HTH domain
MKFESMTDRAIAQEIGQRIEQMRLQQNLTQQYMADEIGLSRLSYRKLVEGAGKFENVIAVLRVLGRLDLVADFVPEVTSSPMQQLKMKGRKRQRASGVKQDQAAESGATDKSNEDSGLDW